MPQRSSNPDQTSVYVAVAVLLVILLVGLVLYLNSRHRQPDWANGPITPGTYTPPATLPTSGPAAVPAPSVPPPTAATPLNVQMLLGNPSNAAVDPANRDNYLMEKTYYALSYNNSKGTPNWVSWRVQPSDLGSAPRKRTFDSDLTLPSGFNVIAHRDYTGSGFDRGHMCPHGDRAANIEMSYATFCMTNIVPQAPNNNRKAWAQLERYTRDLVSGGNRAYVMCGAVGRGGVGENGPAETLAGGRVVVPGETWKVIVITKDKGNDDLANISTGDRVIAVDVPNDQGKVDEEWKGWRCTAASIEAKTGLHFFTALPAETRAVLEAELDQRQITAGRASKDD